MTGGKDDVTADGDTPDAPNVSVLGVVAEPVTGGMTAEEDVLAPDGAAPVDAEDEDAAPLPVSDGGIV